MYKGLNLPESKKHSFSGEYFCVTVRSIFTFTEISLIKIFPELGNNAR